MGRSEGGSGCSGRPQFECSRQVLEAGGYPWSYRHVRFSSLGGLPSRLGVDPIARYHLFPYREEEKFLNQYGQEETALRPTVDVELSRGNLDWRVRALIDTGAPLTVFTRGAGEALDVDFSDRSAPRRRVRLLGKLWDVLGQHVTLTLPPFSDLWWEAQVWFLLDDWDMPYGLLGSEGFLEKWAVSFNKYYDYFVVEPAEEFHRDLPVDPFAEFQKLDLDWEPRDY